MNNVHRRITSRILLGSALVGVVLAQYGCASYPRNIQEGMTHDEVIARFGPPSIERPRADGDRLVYATGPLGQYAFGVDIDRGGRVEQVEQVLTLENFARIQAGTWTEEDVLWNFGPPAEKRRLRDQVTWNYRYRELNVYNSLFTVSFDDAGLVARTENGPDWMFENGGRNGRH